MTTLISDESSRCGSGCVSHPTASPFLVCLVSSDVRMDCVGLIVHSLKGIAWWNQGAKRITQHTVRLRNNNNG